MSLTREQILRSEIKHVEAMLVDLPESFPIDRLSLQARLANLESDLGEPGKKSDASVIAEPIQTIGNAQLLSRPSIAVFCSSKCPGDAILKATKWIGELADDDSLAIVSGFHSAMEKSFLEILLDGRCGLVVCPARSVARYRVPTAYKDAIAENRLVIASSLPESVRSNSASSSRQRNRLVADLASKIVFAHAADGSRTEQFALELLGRGKTVHCLDAGCNTLLSAGAKLMSIKS